MMFKYGKIWKTYFILPNKSTIVVSVDYEAKNLLQLLSVSFHGWQLYFTFLFDLQYCAYVFSKLMGHYFCNRKACSSQSVAWIHLKFQLMEEFLSAQCRFLAFSAVQTAPYCPSASGYVSSCRLTITLKL